MIAGFATCLVNSCPGRSDNFSVCSNGTCKAWAGCVDLLVAVPEDTDLLEKDPLERNAPSFALLGALFAAYVAPEVSTRAEER